MFARPQTPQAPFPYLTRDVEFFNPADGMCLHGTLTYPAGDGPFPAAVLVSGSGPQDRDEEILGHRPFLVLADHLTRAGMAVLRYDDRHFGMQPEQGWRYTTLDLAGDTEAALDFLRRESCIDKESLGIIGHSEGGVIAPLIASRDAGVAWIVCLAGTGLPGREISRQQNFDLAEDARGVEFGSRALSCIADEPDPVLRKKRLSALQRSVYGWWNLRAWRQFRRYLPMSASEWNRFFLNHDPADSWKNVRCPALCLFGSHDIQVRAESNFQAIRAATGHRVGIECRIVEGANHLFQMAGGDAPLSYEQLVRQYAVTEETIAPLVLDHIQTWLSGTVRVFRR